MDLLSTPGTPVAKRYYRFGGRLVAERDTLLQVPVHYLHQDHLGSTTLVSGLTGLVEGEQFRGPYGQPWVSTGLLATDQQYTGQRSFEPVLGSLMHFGARWYSPNLGRFLSPDGVVSVPSNPQDLERYAYVRGNPLYYRDPSGHDPKAGIDFLTGFVKQYALDNNPLLSAQQREALAPRAEDSIYAQVGHHLANAVATAQGLLEVGGGASMMGGGAAACGTGVLCLAGAPAAAAGTGLLAHGSATISIALANEGQMIGGLVLNIIRRTGHAAEHAPDDPETPRPVDWATEDALRAGQFDVMYDTNYGTYVVLGPKDRAHFFVVKDGKLWHNSSMFNPKQNTNIRISNGQSEPVNRSETRIAL